MNKPLRIGLGLIALAAWAALMGVSGVANWTFGYSLATTEFKGLLFGVASVAADGFKALSPIAFLWFFAQRPRRLWPAFSAAAICVVTATYALIAALGFAASERMGTYDKIARGVERASDVKADIRRLEKTQAFVPQHRPLAIVQADLEGAKAQREWRWSEGCTITRGSQTEEFCKAIRALRVEEAAAKTEQELAGKIVAKVQTYDGIENVTGDYQVHALSKFSGIHPETLLLCLVILIVLLIEVGASMGLTVALALLTDPATRLGMALRMQRTEPEPQAPRGTPIERLAGVSVPAPPEKPATASPAKPETATVEVVTKTAAAPSSPSPPSRGAAQAPFPSGASQAAPNVIRKFSLRPPFVENVPVMTGTATRRA